MFGDSGKDSSAAASQLAALKEETGCANNITKLECQTWEFSMQIPWFDPQETVTSPLSTGSVCWERPPEDQQCSILLTQRNIIMDWFLRGLKMYHASVLRH